jgi:hypothetical protein
MMTPAFLLTLLGALALALRHGAQRARATWRETRDATPSWLAFIQGASANLCATVVLVFLLEIAVAAARRLL